MPEPQLIAFLGSERRIGVAHIVRLPAGPIWKGQTWCGRAGEAIDRSVDLSKKPICDLSKKPICKSCLRAAEGAQRRAENDWGAEVLRKREGAGG